MTDILLTIDGMRISAKPGMTILEAARQAGIRIPTLCHDDSLEPYGGCRICIVKVDRMRGLPTACSTQVAEGMDVVTEDQEILQARRMVLRLLLADHPADCLFCRANLNCELQKLALELGVCEHGLIALERKATIDQSNPVFVRDMNRCVLCGRCVGACRDIVGACAIDFIKRGHEAEVGPNLTGDIIGSVCESCGECVEHCPTGALTYREVVPEPEQEVGSICPFCGVGCGILLGVRRGNVIKARGDNRNPVNRGNLCVKGRFGSYQYVNDPNRLTTPLVRRDGALKEATWDEALDLVVEKFSEYRGERFASFASAKVANEDNYLMQKFTRAVMGTNSVDHCARL